MKKVIVVCCLLLALCGCQSAKNEGKSEDYANMGFPGISEDGIYHLVKTDFANEVYFYDFKTDKDVPLCSKVNCNHQNEDCDAYRLTFYKDKDQTLHLPPIYYQNKVYYLYENLQKGKTTLCSSDVDGTDLKKIADIAEMAVVDNATFFDQKVWYTENAFDVDDKGNIISTSNHFKLMCLDLNNHKTEIIKESDDEMLLGRGVYDHQYYFMDVNSVDGKSVNELVKYHEDNQTFESIYQCESGNSFLINKYYYDYDKEAGKIFRIDVSDQSKSNVMDYQPEKGCEVFSVQTDDQGIMTVVLKKDNQVVGESYIDLLSEKVISGTGRVIYLKDGAYYRLNDKGLIYKE